jgi:hypothetical protein
VEVGFDARRNPLKAAKDRTNPMRVYVNASERKTIRANAKAAGMTASRFLCAVGMGSTPRSTLEELALGVESLRRSHILLVDRHL